MSSLHFELGIFCLFEARVLWFGHGFFSTEILGRLWSCSSCKILGLQPRKYRIHQAQNTTTTSLCWSDNKPTLLQHQPGHPPNSYYNKNTHTGSSILYILVLRISLCVCACYEGLHLCCAIYSTVQCMEICSTVQVVHWTLLSVQFSKCTVN
jgi:hypothetical protein